MPQPERPSASLRAELTADGFEHEAGATSELTPRHLLRGTLPNLPLLLL